MCRVGQRGKDEGFGFLLTSKRKGQMNPFGNGGLLLHIISYIKENS